MSGIKLLATGSALPQHVITNHDLEQIMDTSDEWITSRTGIGARHHCQGEECHTSLCLEAAKKYAAPQTQPLQPFFLELEILTSGWKQRLEAPPQPHRWQPEHRALLRYLVQRYWLQAVSDLDLVCRVKLMVSLCLLTASLGGDLLSTAQLMSKEIENSWENIDAILQAAYDTPALTDANLLGLMYLR